MKNVKNVINMKYERNVGICKLQKLFSGITQADHSLSSHFQIIILILFKLILLKSSNKTLRSKTKRDSA